VQILDHISEELFVKVMNGERIVDEDDMEATCSRVVSGRTGAKGKSVCRTLLLSSSVFIYLQLKSLPQHSITTKTAFHTLPRSSL
jgi:hypothetical protein